jgi:hypothetical protein
MDVAKVVQQPARNNFPFASSPPFSDGPEGRAFDRHLASTARPAGPSINTRNGLS